MRDSAVDLDVSGAADGGGDVLTGWRPSPRARRAEQLAQAVLDPAASLDRLYGLVRAAAETTGAENAHISLLTDRQISVIRHRRDADGVQPLRSAGDAEPALVLPLDESLCSMALRHDAAICIPDARADERVAGLRAVADGVLGSYLGAPIHSEDGLVLGVLCVYDCGPHAWTDHEAGELAQLADGVAVELVAVHAGLAADPRAAS